MAYYDKGARRIRFLLPPDEMYYNVGNTVPAMTSGLFHCLDRVSHDNLIAVETAVNTHDAVFA